MHFDPKMVCEHFFSTVPTRPKRLTNTVLTGQEYRAVVELAPSQKVPPLAQAMVSAILKGDGKVKQPKIRVDARQGQIDTGGSDGPAVFRAGWRLTGGGSSSDNDYLSFVQSLSQPLEKPKPEDFVSCESSREPHRLSRTLKLI
jgi:hypothetical protein